MTTLAYLNEPGVLYNLKARYSLDDIYTYTGSILIAVNPFQRLSHLYGTHMMEQYRGVNLGELSPHVYAIADGAYQQMRRYDKSQSILVRRQPGSIGAVSECLCPPLGMHTGATACHERLATHICRSAARVALARRRPASSSCSTWHGWAASRPRRWRPAAPAAWSSRWAHLLSVSGGQVLEERREF